MEKIKVIELFAGVGGFRIGLEKASNTYEVIWSNQWEPSTKSQLASEIYTKRFGNKNHCNQDINKVLTKDIPDHDMLVGGFPCQDYSVARTLNQSAGIIGKKGVLWWDIHRILNEKKQKPDFVLLENVDRLLKSPAKQRGRDFAIMLSSLSTLGYAVEWRVINAADYGMPQRRRRVFLLGYKNNSNIYKQLKNHKDKKDWLITDGLFAENFPVSPKEIIHHEFSLEENLFNLSQNFNIKNPSVSPFKNSGLILDGNVTTIETTPNYKGRRIVLKDVLLPDEDVPANYFIDSDSLKKWTYFKGAKKEKRINKTNGFEYNYTEGAMVFPDALDKPSRTIITGEGGSTPSRFKHVVETTDGRLRRLTPVELERLNMFPDNHTEGATDNKRAFFMGNALVVGIIEQIGKGILNKINKD
jgi:DNA (cytosine-5)-methyltransferase 1